MKSTKILIATLLCISLNIRPALAYTNAKIERIDTYEVSFEDLTLAQRALIFLLGLNWSEVYIKTVFEKTGDAQKVISVSAWSDYEDEPSTSQKDFNMENEAESFLDFVTKTKFQKDEVPRILELFTYLYNESTNEKKFDTSNLFESGGGSMHCQLTKELQKDKNIITIKTFNSRGDNNATIEVVAAKNGERHIEKISARLKIGIKIILTKQPD
jgi:hypothetical protein